MSEMMGFSRKKDDKWTKELVQRIADFIPEYRNLVYVQKWTKTAAKATIIKKLRQEYPDWTEDERSDGALGSRIEYLDEVMAAEKDKNKIPEYDQGFYGKQPR